VLLNFLLFQNVREVGQFSGRAVGFLAISGQTTSLSWICYYKAIQIGRASDVALIDKGSIVITILLSITLLREPVTPKLLIGGVLILAGLLVLVWR
jgi:transporter family protein